MPSPLLSLLTGRTSSRSVEMLVPQRTFADVILPPQTRRALDDAIAQVRNHARRERARRSAPRRLRIRWG
jgi:hypothetical protein